MTLHQYLPADSLASKPSPGDRFAAGTFAPAPGRGRLVHMVTEQASIELRLALRHGEVLTLTLLVPLGLLFGLTLLDVVLLPGPRVDIVVPAVLALAVLSTAFTSQAITLGYDRRYGVIRRLAATALPRWLLLAGRLAAVVGVVIVQMIVLSAAALTLGWRPAPGGIGWAALLLVLGCAAFGGLGILLGGTLRAEIVLAVANVVWFVLLLGGGIILPVGQLPGVIGTIAAALPSGALAEGLHSALAYGRFPGFHSILVLTAWAFISVGIAARAVRLR